MRGKAGDVNVEEDINPLDARYVQVADLEVVEEGLCLPMDYDGSLLFLPWDQSMR